MSHKIKIHETSDFSALVRTAAEQIRATAGIVEKDYWVTEVLRTISVAREFTFLFKGGTSLSKGYGLIRRFSEDVDILILDQNGEPPGQAKGKKLLKAAEAAASSVPEINLNKGHEDSFSGKSPPKRTSILDFHRTEHDDSLLPYIKLEMSVHSGVFPSESKQINSLIAQQILTIAPGSVSGFSNVTPFDVKCLDPLRTFAEKVNALASAARKNELPARVSLYYDLFYLLGPDGISKRLTSQEHLEIKRHIEAVDREMRQHDDSHDYLSPSSSSAFAPSDEILAALKGAYEGSSLYYGNKPTFEEVMDLITLTRAKF